MVILEEHYRINAELLLKRVLTLLGGRSPANTPSNEYSHNAEMWEKSFYWQSSPILLRSMRRVLMEFLLLSSLRSNWIKANINYSGPPLLLLFSELIRLLPFHHQLLRTSPRMPLRVAAFNDIIPHSSTVEWQSLHKLRFWKHRCLEMDDSRLG